MTASLPVGQGAACWVAVSPNRRSAYHAPSERLEHRLHPISAGFAVPVFALAATGITLAAAGDAISDRIAVGVFAGLLIGKIVGIYGGARIAVRLGLGTLPDQVTWADVSQWPYSAPSATRSAS